MMHCVCQIFYKHAQTYIIYILIGLALGMDIQGTFSDDRQNPVLNTKPLSPLYGSLTAGDYIVIFI